MAGLGFRYGILLGSEETAGYLNRRELSAILVTPFLGTRKCSDRLCYYFSRFLGQ